MHFCGVENAVPLAGWTVNHFCIQNCHDCSLFRTSVATFLETAYCYTDKVKIERKEARILVVTEGNVNARVINGKPVKNA
jgi:hypothetical protein